MKVNTKTVAMVVAAVFAFTANAVVMGVAQSEGSPAATQGRTMLAIVEAGGATATVVIPANPGKWTNEAARWLQAYV